jgi:hypothetical protein
MQVTSRPAPNLPGRQTCSSTPRDSTPCRRRGSSARRRASTFSAAHSVCQSTPSRRASALTVVSSSLKASAAQITARRVSNARGGARGCSSVNVTIGHAGSRHRHTRLRHATRTRRCPNGASRSRCSRRPCGTASTPQRWQPSTCRSVSTVRRSAPPCSRSAARTRTPGTPNITAAVGQPSLQSISSRPSSQLLGRY